MTHEIGMKKRMEGGTQREKQKMKESGGNKL